MIDMIKYNKLLGSTAGEKTHACVIKPEKMQLFKIVYPTVIFVK